MTNIINTDKGCAESIDVIKTELSLQNKFILDIGCGAMGFTRQLLDLGAQVLGVDPDSVQAQLNRGTLANAPITGLDFAESSGEKLPVADDSVDGVVFVYSLHHIPESVYPQVFAEVLRVLRPEGFLLVIEPTGCPLFDVMRLYHNEDAELAAAQRVLHDEVAVKFNSARVLTYHGYKNYESFEDYVKQATSKSFNSHYSTADVRRNEVRSAFEKHAPAYRFQTPKQAMLLQGLNRDLCALNTCE